MTKVDKKETRKQLEQKITELTEMLQRLQADFDNYRKRQEKENKEYAQATKAHFIKKLLPVIDSFQLSIKNCQTEKKGMELLYAQLFAILEAEGVQPITILIGKETFNPHKHEVLLTTKSDKPEGTILEEIQTGYTLNDIILRTAKVNIAVPKGDTNENNRN